jgi:hypothetical protein
MKAFFLSWQRVQQALTFFFGDGGGRSLGQHIVLRNGKEEGSVVPARL